MCSHFVRSFIDNLKKKKCLIYPLFVQFPIEALLRHEFRIIGNYLSDTVVLHRMLLEYNLHSKYIVCNKRAAK